MQILILCGSPREQSLTRVLTDLAYDYARRRYADATVDYLDLSRVAVDPFRGYDLEYSAATRETVSRVTRADVLIIGAPIYNGLISAALKNLFEHIDYRTLEGRVAGFIIHSGGPVSSLQVQGQLMALMTYFRVLSNPRAVFSLRDKHFDEGRTLRDEQIRERIARLVDDTVALARGEPAE